MQAKINEIHAQLKALFPDAVSVNIFVSSEGIEVTPKFRTNLDGYTMKTLTGAWVNRAGKSEVSA